MEKISFTKIHSLDLDLTAAVQQNLFTYMLDLVTIACRVIDFSLEKHNDRFIIRYFSNTDNKNNSERYRNRSQKKTNETKWRATFYARPLFSEKYWIFASINIQQN